MAAIWAEKSKFSAEAGLDFGGLTFLGVNKVKQDCFNKKIVENVKELLPIQLNEHKQLGLIKTNYGKIVYVDESLEILLKAKAPIVGKSVTSLIPNYIFPEEIEKPVMSIERTSQLTLLVTSIKIPSQNDSFLLSCCSLDTTDLIINRLVSSVKHFSLSSLDTLLKDVVITDSQGVVLHVTDNFNERWGVAPNQVIGKTVYDLADRGVFSPSVTAIVLETKEKKTMIQQNLKGEKYLITGAPVFDENNNIDLVVSYVQDIEDFVNLEKQYKKLQLQVKRYSSELKELRQKNMNSLPIIAKSEAMKDALSLALKVSSTDINILLTGETGVGKTLIARMLHQHSERQKGPFIEINCGAIPETLLESELFGYEPGAFTGASKFGKVGVVEMADSGTLFLDEIGDLPIALQVKLLKVIQEKKIIRIGGIKPIDVDFRLISATNQDLQAMIQKGKFRQDLFYRINVVPIIVPPLRERPEDILEFITHFLSQSNTHFVKNTKFSNNAITMLLAYDWPGNVRELKNLVNRLVITIDSSVIGTKEIENIFGVNNFFLSSIRTLAEAKNKLEEEMIKEAYSKRQTSVGVAKYLGISQAAASRKIRKYVKR